MSDQIFQEIAESVRLMDAKSKSAKQMIDFARSAGEDTVKLESQLKTLDVQTDKWRNALKEKGIIVNKI
jgi:hypothetical protein